MSKLIFYGICLQAICTGILLAGPGNAQSKKLDEIEVSINVQSQSLKKVFSLLETKTGFSFTYNDRVVDENTLLSLTAKKSNLQEVLTQIADEAKVSFKRINDNIFVSKSETYTVKEEITTTPLPVQSKIRGTVTSGEDKAPLPGVSIIIKGTTVGTTTDLNGQFAIDASSDDVLQFSYIGHINQEVEVGNRTEISIELALDMEQLEEVVVVGYGMQKKRDVIGSVASVTSEDITKLPVPSLDAGLQGLAPGVQAVGTGGVPGAPVRILVRGTNSISAGTDPLYIVDGMPIYSSLNGLERTESTTPQSPLATINPNDIESIEVLKDAAATAIYGSRGSNGVVIITTKNGKGAGGFDFTYNAGISTIIKDPSEMGFANTSEYFTIMDETRANSGLPPFDPDINTNLFIDNPVASLTREEAMSTNTDWFDEILQKGKFQEVNLSLHNSTDKANYYISANYRDDTGILKTNQFQRFSVRANTDMNILENLTAGIRLNLAYTKNDRVKSGGGGGLQGNSGGTSGGFGQANSNALTWYPINNANHQSGYWNPLSGNNLTANIDEDLLLDEVDQYRALGNFYFNYTIPWVKGLSVRSELSADFLQNNSTFWVSEYLREGGSSASDQNVTYNSFNYNFYATYNKSISKNFALNVVLGTESQETKQRRRFMLGEDLPSSYQQLGSPNNYLSMYSGLENERALRSYFGRSDLKFKDRYLLGFSFRRDGSSAFPENSRWANFSAVSAGWIITDEPFFNSAFFEMLKLRGSYGQTGNQNIGNNRFITTFRNDRRYLSQELLNGGTSITNLGASDLTWETTNSYDIGLDFALLAGRISGSIAYYYQDVEDMLLQVPLPLSITLDTSNPTIWANAGRMKNAGVEFNFTSVNVHTAAFKWSSTFNITTNKNEVLNLTDDVDKNGQGLIASNTITRTGGRLGAYYLAEYAGIDPERGVEMIYEIDQELFDETGETVKTGNLIPATLTNVRDNKIIHDDQTGLPTYYGGINNKFEFKGFDLSVFFTFMGGNYLYDYVTQRSHYPSRGQRMLSTDLIGNSWSAENPNAEYAELRWDMAYDWDWDSENGQWVETAGNYNNETYFHDRFLEKANFIRLKNLTFGYNFPPTLAKKMYMSSLRVYVSATNLLTFTNYSGWDPEAIVTNTGNLNLAPGMIYLPPLPHLKTYSVGINAKF